MPKLGAEYEEQGFDVYVRHLSELVDALKQALIDPAQRIQFLRPLIK